MNDSANQQTPHPFGDAIGLTSVERGEGRCTNEIVIEPMHMNPHGVVHGAVLYALADTGMGGALTSLLPDGKICATIEIKINYFRPATGGRLRSETSVVHLGSRTAALESSVSDDEGRLLARATGTYMILDRNPA